MTTTSGVFTLRPSASSTRLDAEYHDSNHSAIERAVRRLPGGELSLAFAVNPSGARRSPPANQHELPYIDIQAVDRRDGMIDADPIEVADLPSRAEFLTRSGDLLVSNVRPERNAVAVVPAPLDGALASSGFTLLRPFGADACYEFLFLKTAFGRTQLERRQRGSMYPAVLPTDVSAVWLPAPAESDVTFAREVVSAAHEAYGQF